MKNFRTIIVTAIAVSLTVGVMPANADESATTVVVTETQDVSGISTKDHKAVNKFHKAKKTAEQKIAAQASKAEYKAAKAAWIVAVEAWRVANAELLTSLRTISNNYKSTVSAAKTAYASATDKVAAKVVLKNAIADAKLSRDNATSALGSIPEKPQPPVNDGHGKAKKRH